MKYNHAFDIAFALTSNTPDASDVTELMVMEALNKRIFELLLNEEILEAVGVPFDTYEEEDE